MLLSMTGFGEARHQEAGLTVQVEVRSVNNRHLKLSTRLSDGYGGLEPQVETLVRQHVRRGAIQLNVNVIREVQAEDYQLNRPVLVGYHRQLSELNQQLGIERVVPLEALLLLPGVVADQTDQQVDLEAHWPVVRQALVVALQQLRAMRAEEGQAMRADLRGNHQAISQQLDQIQQRAPQVIEAYQTRLTERINRLLAQYEIQIQPADVVREIGVFAERADISEEVVRLRSHLEQFDATLDSQDSAGRKLEFLIQEMVRETNTIGSKANDAEIARHVVEIKTIIERLREMVQNVE